jgi:integrase
VKAKVKDLGGGRYGIEVIGKVPSGLWMRERYTQRHDNISAAREWGRRRIEALIRGDAKPNDDRARTPGDILVSKYAAKWLETRDTRTADDDTTRLEKHVLPVIGELAMKDVSKQHIRDLFASLKARLRSPILDDLTEEQARKLRIEEKRAGKLSAATIRNTFSTLSVMFAQASADDIVPYTPCVLPPRFLPADDSDVTRPFTAAELETLLGCSDIPAGRRMLYALCFFTGTRIGEAVAFGWSSIGDESPLKCFSARRAYSPKRKAVGETKTGIARLVPCHPVLGAMLQLWWDEGFRREHRRDPKQEDYICPRVEGGCQQSVDVWKSLQRDLAALGFGHRKVHALRTSFITLMRQAGVDKEVVRTMTHGRKASRDVIDRNYTIYDWATLCAAVLKLPVGRAPGTAFLPGNPLAALKQNNQQPEIA